MPEAHGWTDIQRRRLKELDAGPEDIDARFDTAEARNRAFLAVETRLKRQARGRLGAFLATGLRPRLCLLETLLVETLNRLGFAQVVTPIVISGAHLARMSIDDAHPLSRQVFWIDGRRCLRPMLAPNLYSLMVDLGRVAERPVRFFEIGPCFRKESYGARHSSEFTMLNLVEMGLPPEARLDRLRELGGTVAEAAGITDYRFERESSEVYGDTLDVVAGEEGVEIASGAMGPHPLDAAWRVTDTWVGLGFGLERLVMVAQGGGTLGRWGRSLAYLDGIRLNL
ncbi:MAG: pyrrolysine--tRNA(Pyl) ligase large subunit [Syntrophobacteraceae bacterium]|nr:hypothetical protein [Desulfobacteraceae bacterium]